MNTASRSLCSSFAVAVATAWAAHWAGLASADTTASFTFAAGDVSLNAAASFNDTGTGTTGAVIIDPNNANSMYVLNRNIPTSGGGYAYNLMTHTRVSNSAGPVLLSTNVSGLGTWTDASDPYAGMVGADGSFYMLFDVSSALYKISGPLSDTPTATKILGNYNLAGDDDPSYIASIPAAMIAHNTALSGAATPYTANDIIMLDSGIDTNNVTALVAIHADGSDGTNPLVLWKRSSAGANTARGGVDAKNGNFYFIQTVPEINSINGTSYPTLYRMNSSGAIQSIGLNLPPGFAFSTLDDSIAVNPQDGSVWITNIDAGTSRTVYRVDTQYMSNPATDQYVAPVTVELTATGFNLGINSATFSADGKILYGGTPDGTDKIWALNTLVHSPGDLNGDGNVNADDYAIFDRARALGLNTGYVNGDFNLDGVVNSGDYAIIDAAYVLSHPMDPEFLAERAAEFGDGYVASLLSSVPEPAGLSVLASLALVLGRRRRILN